MGLTIHYTLRWTPPGEASARRFVEEARRKIARARLGKVSPVRPAGGGPFDGLEFVELAREALPDGGTQVRSAEVEPVAGWLFTLAPGAGCEPAVFGLCRYPETVRYAGRDWPLPKLRGWRLSSFSKTQYASLHGWEHFRRCHLAVLAALDVWRGLGARVKISDEGGYWPRRSERALRRSLDEMNGAVAGLAGALRDAEEEGGGDRAAIESPILAHPQFERLEADGVTKHGRKIAATAAALRP